MGGHGGSAGRGRVVRVRGAQFRITRALDAGGDHGLGCAPGPAPGQGHRRRTPGAPGFGADARAVPLAGGRGGADRPARGGPGAAHPERGDGLAGPAAPGTALATARGGRRRPGPGGWADGPGPGPGGGQARCGGGAADGPAAAGDGGPGPAATDRVGTDQRRLRGPGRGCPAAGRGPVPAGAGPTGGGDQRGPVGHATGARPDRWAGRHPTAPDDRQGHGLPGPGGRDRDGQRDPLAVCSARGPW
jgi:hypothetical protein